MRALGLAMVIAGGLVVLGQPGAWAQDAPNLVESDPADGAELEQPPTEVVLTFDAPIGEASLLTMACNGDPFGEPNTSRPEVGGDGLTLRVDILQPMPAGTCNVAWSVTPPEGAPNANGRFSFTVLNSPTTVPGTTTPGGTTPAATTPVAADDDSDGSDTTVLDASEVSDGATWLGRVLSTLGLAVLFGALVVILVGWPEGPEYILAVRFLRSVWLLALAGTLLYVVALSAAVNEVSLGKGLSPARWLDLLDAGWPGRAALARLVLVVACVWVVLRPERVIDPTTQLPAIALPTLAVVTIGLTRTGGELAILGVVAGIVHALAMAIWVGGVVLLARVVLAGPGEEDLVHAVRGFNRISGPAIVLTVVSGLIQLYRLDGGSLFSDSHGRVLLLKTVLVAVMLFVGLTARQVAHARLARAHDLTPATADRLRRAFGTEAAIGVIVIGMSGWLMAFTPAKAPDRDQIDYAVEETFVDPTSQLDLTVSLAPGRVGGNRLRVEVRAPESGVTGLTVDFVPPADSGQGTISQPIPLSGRGVAVSAADYLPLPVPGAWKMVVSGTTPTGALSAASADFEVLTAGGELSTPGIEPTPSAPTVPAPTTVATTSSG